MAFGSYTGGARTYNSYVNQVNQSIAVAIMVLKSRTSIVINQPPAHEPWHARAAPEIGGEGAAGGVTLLAGILLVIRGRRHAT